MKEKYQVILFDDEEDKEIYNFYNEKEAIDYAKSFARKEKEEYYKQLECFCEKYLK